MTRASAVEKGFDLQKAIQSYNEGLNCAQIGILQGFSEATVYKHLAGKVAIRPRGWTLQRQEAGEKIREEEGKVSRVSFDEFMVENKEELLADLARLGNMNEVARERGKPRQTVNFWYSRLDRQEVQEALSKYKNQQEEKKRAKKEKERLEKEMRRIQKQEEKQRRIQEKRLKDAPKRDIVTSIAYKRDDKYLHVKRVLGRRE